MLRFGGSRAAVGAAVAVELPDLREAVGSVVARRVRASDSSRGQVALSRYVEGSSLLRLVSVPPEATADEEADL